MAEKTPSKPRSTRQKTAAPTTKTETATEMAEAPDLHAILAWLHTVDDWSLAGYQNKLPRWVYIVAAFLILS